MTMFALILVILDLFLVGLVLYMRNKPNKDADIEILKEIHQEKEALKELTLTLAEDIKQHYSKARQLLDKVSLIATELEVELKEGKATIAKDVDSLLDEYTDTFKKELAEISRQKSILGSTLQEAKKSREILNRSVQRANKLAMFFKKKVPYEEVLEEIEDKKYVDARYLLSQGMVITDVAKEVGLPESEVKLLTAIP